MITLRAKPRTMNWRAVAEEPDAKVPAHGQSPPANADNGRTSPFHRPVWYRHGSSARNSQYQLRTQTLESWATFTDPNRSVCCMLQIQKEGHKDGLSVRPEQRSLSSRAHGLQLRNLKLRVCCRRAYKSCVSFKVWIKLSNVHALIGVKLGRCASGWSVPWYSVWANGSGRTRYDRRTGVRYRSIARRHRHVLCGIELASNG